MKGTAWEKAGAVRTGSAKKQRDLYLEMKRLENPNFDFIPMKQQSSALNSILSQKKTKPSKRMYRCKTQQNDTLEDLFLGLQKGNIQLWESGSVINRIARSDGYPSTEHAMESAVGLFQAAQEWNEIMDGRVKVQYMTNFDDAAFQLAYGGVLGRVLVSAFFPDEWEMSRNTVLVYEFKYDPMPRPLMLHELGHVLGLRHEHSHSEIPPFNPPEDSANGPESILYSVKNPISVMAYFQGVTIQDSEVASIRMAYDDLEDGKVITGQGRFGAVQKTIQRVVPNN